MAEEVSDKLLVTSSWFWYRHCDDIKITLYKPGEIKIYKKSEIKIYKPGEIQIYKTGDIKITLYYKPGEADEVELWEVEQPV